MRNVVEDEKKGNKNWLGDAYAPLNRIVEGNNSGKLWIGLVSDLRGLFHSTFLHQLIIDLCHRVKWDVL